MHPEGEKMREKAAAKSRRTSAETILIMLSDAVDGCPQLWSAKAVAEVLSRDRLTAQNRFARLREQGLVEPVVVKGRQHFHRVNLTAVKFLEENFELIDPSLFPALDPNGHGRRLIGIKVILHTNNGRNGKKGGSPSNTRPTPSPRRLDVLRIVRVCGGHGSAAYMARITTSKLVDPDTILSDLKWLSAKGWIKPGYKPNPDDPSTWFWLALGRQGNGS